MSMNRIFYCLRQHAKRKREPRAIEHALYTTAKKRKKNDSLEGGVRKRAETEGKEC